MPKIQKGFFETKRKILIKVKKVIRENPKIKSDVLVAKLNVNFPYISERNALETIKNLHIDGQILINNEDEVTLIPMKDRVK